MSAEHRFVSELGRRHVVRAAIVYVAAVWALAQGIAQLTPVLALPALTARWFVIACAIGFPFWIAFAWYFKFTARGLEREGEAAEDKAAVRRAGRKLDYWIIGILAIAVVLLLTNLFVLHRNVTIKGITLTPSSAVIPAKSVAVLPFVNESREKSQEFFSDGLSQDLINALSQFAGLKVISRNSAFQFRGGKQDARTIGSKLGVAHLLEGAVQHSGNEVRITVTLVKAADGSTLWSQHYDRPYRDLFALQDDITQAVAAVLRAKLLTTPGAVVQSDRPPSGNLAAYAAYQQGRAYYGHGTETGYRRAIAAIGKAIHLDPRYAAAYAELSLAWNGLAAQSLTRAEASQANAQARRSVITALQLDPDSSLAHRARAYLLLNVDMDWTGAEVEARHALQLAPNDPSAQFDLGNALASLGRLHQATDLTRQALVADPRNDGWYYWLAVYLTGLGRLDEARQAATTAISLQPGADGYHGQLAIIEVLRADAKAAVTAARQELAGFWHDAAMALALQIGPNPAAADAELGTLIENYANAAPYQIAQVYALRREPNAMFKWLERAWASRDPGIGYLLSDPFVLRYRDDPRFAAFAKKVGLPTTTDAVALK